MIKQTGVVTAVALLFSLPSAYVGAQTQHRVKTKESCVTGPTTRSGKRRSCHFLLELDAPDGHGFLPDSVRNHQDDNRGSGSGCAPVKFIYETLDQGVLAYVARIEGEGNARSPKEQSDDLGDTGRVECVLSGVYTKLPK